MTILFSLLMSLSGYAQNHNNHQHVETIVENAPLKLNGECTDWAKAQGVSCQMAGLVNTRAWRRKCAHNWDEVIFCWNQDPNKLTMICTPWYRESAECINGQQVWARECGDVRYKKHLCSKTNPNTQE